MEMERIVTKVYDAPCGRLMLGAYGGMLCICDWMNGEEDRHIERLLRCLPDMSATDGAHEVLDMASGQLDEYFAGKRRDFDVPLLTVGTEFQKTVWNELLKIPYGETISYGETARRIGRPTAVRAVANANHANPVGIFIPCHRVIGSDGSLTGYGGGLDVKDYLLRLEKR